MISIIVVGRNDNYGGDFEGRLLATARYNLDELEKRGIESELIFTEWNPLTDRPLLSDKIAVTFDRARCIVVDGAIHRLVSENRYIDVFEYLAKNVGARRARGDWLLLTNPDDFFGKDVLDFLATAAFDEETLYRAGWIEIDDASEIDRVGLADHYASDPPPYCCASGDFIFCSKTLFERLGGFREDLTFSNTHNDSIFCCAAFDLTGRVRKVGNTYHLRHSRDAATRRRLDYDWRKVSRRPQESYGLNEGCTAASLHPRITKLTLPVPLLREANRKQPAEPRVPRAYRLTDRPARALQRWERRLRGLFRPREA